MENDTNHRANVKRQYSVTRDDLPLSCPMPDMRVWDSHPRVFLPIEKTGRAICPYCEAEFTLVDQEDNITIEE